MATVATGTVVETTTEVVRWKGAENRPIRAQRACPCGCDNRGRKVPIVGYVTGSNESGEGITIFAPDEATYQRFVAVFGESD